MSLKSAHKASLREGEETKSDTEAVTNVTVAGQRPPLSMCRANKEADGQMSQSHYKEKSQTCGREGKK